MQRIESEEANVAKPIRWLKGKNVLDRNCRVVAVHLCSRTPLPFSAHARSFPVFVWSIRYQSWTESCDRRSCNPVNSSVQNSIGYRTHYYDEPCSMNDRTSFVIALPSSAGQPRSTVLGPSLVSHPGEDGNGAHRAAYCS
jgi:hypothetical protein